MAKTRQNTIESVLDAIQCLYKIKSIKYKWQIHIDHSRFKITFAKCILQLIKKIIVFQLYIVLIELELDMETKPLLIWLFLG